VFLIIFRHTTSGQKVHAFSAPFVHDPRFVMTSFLHKLLRGSVLAIMILLAGTANLICVSYDADDDDDTPPVTVEMSLAAPCRKNLHVPQQQNHVSAFTEELRTELMVPAGSESVLAISQAAPQFVVPLRT
jgi:hypothetical protein